MNPKVQKTADLIVELYPKFGFRLKSETWHQQAIGWLLFWMWRFPVDENGKRRLERTYMTRYTTTIGYNVYLADPAILNERYYWRTLAHELVHMWDKVNPIAYLFPQILAPLSILAVGSIWFEPMIWCLLFLVFILPFPAPYRMRYEVRGYTMTLATQFWDTNAIHRDSLLNVESQFLTGHYYWMWPFEDDLRSKFDAQLHRIRSGEILSEPIFKKVYDMHLEHEGRKK